MKAANVLGFIGGAVLACLGLFLAPGGWGLCGIQTVYPIRVPSPADTLARYGFDDYECPADTSGVIMLLVYLAAVFLISGAFAARIGETNSPVRGAAAVAVVSVPVVLLMAFSGGEFALASTLSVGVAVVFGANAFAYMGGHLAKRNAY